MTQMIELVDKEIKTHYEYTPQAQYSRRKDEMMKKEMKDVKKKQIELEDEKCNFLILFLLYFFQYHLVLLYSPLPCNYNTVANVHESFFLFVQSLHPLTSPSLAVALLSINLSLFCIVIQFTRFTYE